MTGADVWGNKFVVHSLHVMQQTTGAGRKVWCYVGRHSPRASSHCMLFDAVCLASSPMGCSCLSREGEGSEAAYELCEGVCCGPVVDTTAARLVPDCWHAHGGRAQVCACASGVHGGERVD